MSDEVPTVPKVLSVVDKALAWFDAHPKVSHGLVSLVTLIAAKSKYSPQLLSVLGALLGMN